MVSAPQHDSEPKQALDLARPWRPRVWMLVAAGLLVLLAGPVRAYVRDLVDARRNIAGILLPIAVLSFVILLIPIPTVQSYGPLVLLVAIVAAILDTVVFARAIGQKVRAKFPKGDSSDLSTKGSALGFYAFNRACLFRRWRVPRPRVAVGTKID